MIGSVVSTGGLIGLFLKLRERWEQRVRFKT
jgi:hypothetical protein